MQLPGSQRPHAIRAAEPGAAHRHSPQVLLQHGHPSLLCSRKHLPATAQTAQLPPTTHEASNTPSCMHYSPVVQTARLPSFLHMQLRHSRLLATGTGWRSSSWAGAWGQCTKPVGAVCSSRAAIWIAWI